jgi:type IV pilus assembly protein PilE
MKQQNGFTLVELMIVVVIVAILASVALPAYQDYLIRGKLAEATSNLADARVKMEQYFQDNRTYDAGGCPASVSTSTDYFTYTCTNLGTDTYTLTATGKAGTNLATFSFTVDQANAKTTTSPWGNGACWITTKGGAC